MIVWPATTVVWPSVLVTTWSAEVLTVVETKLELLAVAESVVAEVIEAVLLNTVPDETEGATLTVSTNTGLPPEANNGFEQVIVPPDPTAGVVQDQPAIAGSETKVVPAGSVSLHDAESAAAGPLFVALMV